MMNVVDTPQLLYSKFMYSFFTGLSHEGQLGPAQKPAEECRESDASSQLYPKEIEGHFWPSWLSSHEDPQGDHEFTMEDFVPNTQAETAQPCSIPRPFCALTAC